MGNLNKLHLGVMTALRGAGGGGEETARAPIESPDSLRSIAYARIVDLVSEGEIVGFADQANPLRCVFLNETPVANEDGTLNFRNIQIDSRVGTQTQDYLPNFEGVENEIAVGVELRDDTPWVRSITNLNLNSVRVRLSTPTLTNTNTTTGDISGHSVGYDIELQTDGGAFVTKLTSAFTGKTTSKYERSHRIQLPPATTGWTLRVNRTTPNSEEAFIQDLTFVESFAEIVEAKLRMPMSALVSCIVDAEQFNSIPSRAYRMKGRIIRVPSNYDPDTREYTGIWDGTFQSLYSNNPAWVFYDMALNTRYGLGHLVPAELMDKWALYRIAQYCDGLVPDGFGNLEPRFTCNLVLQSQNDALRVMQDLATVFRGIIYANGGSITAVADMPEDPVYTYTPANVIEGKFVYSGSSRKVRHTVALVSWTDLSDFGRAKVEYVEDPEGVARYGIQQTEIIAIGCTSQGQARRWGRYLLATERFETDTVAFGVGMDGTVVAPGKIINIADPLRAGERRGGRIKSATANSVTVDFMAITAAPGDTLVVTLPTGVTERRIIDTIVGLVITVTVNFSAVPVSQSVWAVDSVGIPLSSYRVLAVGDRDEGDSLGYNITAIVHVPGKFGYADTGEPIDVQPIPPVPGPVVPSPTGLTITQRDVADQNTTAKIVNLSWDAVTVAVAYNVQWRQGNASWMDLGTAGYTNIDIPNVNPGPFEVQVVAINSVGKRSQPTFGGPFDITPVSTPPGFVEDLTTGLEALEEIALENQADIAQEVVDRLELEAELAVTNAQLAVLQGQVGDILEADEWVLENEYPEGDLVQTGGVLYRALQDVPANTPISDVLYWEAIGNYASLGEAVSATAALATATSIEVTDLDGELTALTVTVTQQGVELDEKAEASAVDLLTTRVTEAEGEIDANTAAITSLEAEVDDKADAAALTALTTRVTTAEGNITTNANNITSLTATVAGKADTSALNALDARVTTAEGTITANSSSITSLTATLGGIAADDLIINGSFEYDGNWFSTPNGSVLPAATSYYGPTGNHIYHYTGTWSLWIQPGGERTVYNKAVFPLLPGQEVRGSMRVRTQAGTQPDASTTVRLGIRWMDKDGVHLSNGYVSYVTLDGSTPVYYPTNGYIENVYVAPANAAFGQFFIYVSPFTVGGVFVDDVQASTPSLEDAATASAVSALEARMTSAEGVNTAQASDITILNANVGDMDASIYRLDQVTASAAVGNALRNPSFEDDDDGWILGNAQTQILTSAANARTGEKLLRLGVDGGAGIATQEDYVPVKAAQQVRVSMYGGGYGTFPNAGSQCRLNIRWYDVDKVQLASGGYINTGGNLVAPTTRWTQTSAIVTVPAGAAYMRLVITTNSTSGFWAVEDVSLEVLTDGMANAYASSGVTIDVNGYVTGYRQTNDGSTGIFAIVADMFQIVSPGGGARTEFSNGNWRVYDSSGVLRVRMGIW